MADHADHHVWGRVALILGGMANGGAWIHSIVVDNANVGAIVTAMTIFGMGVCSGIIYFVKNVWPVISNARFDYLERRDKLMSSTLAGQMERLNRNLEDAKEQADANLKLAETASKQADRLQDTLELAEKHGLEQAAVIAGLTGANARLTASMADISSQLARARETLHAISNDRSAVALQTALVSLNSQIGPLGDQVAENKAKLDETAAKVDAVTDFGAKVAQAGDVLIRSGSSDNIQVPTLPMPTPPSTPGG